MFPRPQAIPQQITHPLGLHIKYKSWSYRGDNLVRSSRSNRFNWIRIKCLVLCPILTEIGICRQIFIESKYKNVWKPVGRKWRCCIRTGGRAGGRTDGRTDRHDGVSSRYSPCKDALKVQLVRSATSLKESTIQRFSICLLECLVSFTPRSLFVPYCTGYSQC